jgi:hypothetical protein
MPARVPVFYRIVQSNPPTQSDFTSNEAKGVPAPNERPETRRLWRGLSVFATEAQARSKARQFPALGRYIARLEVSETAPLVWERTLRNSRGHHTLWGEPQTLLTLVRTVVPVEPPAAGG